MQFICHFYLNKAGKNGQRKSLKEKENNEISFEHYRKKKT
jgi:hypothetical protein